MGTRNRQTAQKRPAALVRRCPRPPSADTPGARPEPQAHRSLADTGNPVPVAREDARLPPVTAQPATPRRQPAIPRITDAIIAEGRYELVRAPDHAETRAWHVLVGGRLAGLVRPTWRGERSRPGWEPVDAAGTALPATAIGRTPPARHARPRDPAAVPLRRTTQRQQQHERRK